MSTALITSLVLLVGLAIGIVIGQSLARSRGAAATLEIATLKALLEKSEERLKDIEGKNESQSKIATQMEEMKGTVEKMRQQAQEAAEKRVQSETDLNRTITEMRSASTTLFDETRKIAGALSSSQSRGKFGEAQLELLLELAGLTEGIEYTAQRSTTDFDSTGIPDVTVKMPGDAKIFIDSKFPFERFLDAFATEDQTLRDQFLKAHSDDLLKHAVALSKRGYHKSEGSPDVVVLFLPFETLLVEALRVNPLLLNKAFDVNVTIATPTTMMALLRSVGHLYTRNKLAENADDITKVASTFLKNLTLLHTKIVAVGKAINTTAKAYEDLVPTAEKTVLSPAKKIHSLGVAGDKEKLAIQYPEPPSDVRELNNPNLDEEDGLVEADDYIDVEIVEVTNGEG
jgi:DNA recombination protein RmuC